MKKQNNQIIQFYKSYISQYTSAFSTKQLQKISNIQKIIEKKIKEKKFIFVCGNGGSASIANHFLCDFNKGVKETSKYKILPKVISLSNSVEAITAIANDKNFDKIFEDQITNFSSPGDCLIVMSCSGKSKNILKLLKHAKNKNLYTISLTSFSNNLAIKKLSNINFNADVKNYGIGEDIFQSVMHIISQSLRKNYIKNKNIIL